jgi:hypothetical protein
MYDWVFKATGYAKPVKQAPEKPKKAKPSAALKTLIENSKPPTPANEQQQQHYIRH